MYYGFDTSNENAAIAALLVYGVWTSRDRKRFKIDPGVWGTVERATKSSAKRAMDLTDFIEKLKSKLMCPSIRPSAMASSQNTITMVIDPRTGEMIQKQDRGRREFWTSLLETTDHEPVLDNLYRKTSLVIALVRERLEREKALVQAGILKDVDNQEEDEAHDNA